MPVQPRNQQNDEDVGPAIELQDRSEPAVAVGASPNEREVTYKEVPCLPAEQAASSRTESSREQSSTKEARLRRLRKWWGHHIRITVGHEDCRDHFALERTWLAWQRTSLAFSILGIALAQLFTLTQPDRTISRKEFGIPLSAACVVMSIATCIIGSIRFWRQQQAIVKRLTVHAGGWEHVVIGVLAIALMVAGFVLVIVSEAQGIE